MRTRHAVTATLTTAILILVVPRFLAQIRRNAPTAESAVSHRVKNSTNVAASDPVSFRVVFGFMRTEPKSYDGNVKVTGGKLLSIGPWRFLQQDAVIGDHSWKLTTKRMVFENEPDDPTTVTNGSMPALNLVPAGLIVTVDRSASDAVFETRQGTFSVRIRDLHYGNILRYFDNDVLVERVPTATRLSPKNAEQHDYPSITVTRKGQVWTAWQAYQDRGDNVYAAAEGQAPARLTTEKGDIFRTSIGEDGQGHIHVIWAERRGEDWELYERVYDGANWSAARQITSTNSPNFFHKLIPVANGLQLIWVGWENGESYLYRAAYSGEGWSAPQRIGGPSVWSPDGTADRQGSLYVAWDSYINGNYDIFFRRVSATGTADPVEQVTHSPRFEAHASVAIDGQGRPWLAWDESGANWGKDWNHQDMNRATVLYKSRTIRVVVKENGQWKEAPSFGAAVPDRIHRYWQLPHLAVDGTGRVWTLFQIRTSALNNRDDFWCSGGLWDLYLTTLDHGVWKPAAFVPDSTGRNESPFQVVGAGDRIWMTWSTDDRTLRDTSGGYQAPTSVHYDVYTAQAAAGPAAGTVALTNYVERREHPEIMHPNEKEDVARIRAYRTEVNGTDYRILRGDFHRHSDISNDGSGDGSLEDFYRYMIDVASMDTGIITDHNMGGDVEYNWWRTEKSYDLFHIRGRYTPLFGYERSVNYPNGHRNVVFDHRGVRTLPVSAAENRAQINSGSVVYPYLRQNRGICMEHSLATGQGTDYRDNDPELEPLVEIYQGYHAAYEYAGGPRAESATNHVLIHGAYEPAGFWWNALAKGLKLGVEASSDHISTHCSYTLIYTPTTARTDIVENMRHRHAYAATDNIVVDFEAHEPDGKAHLMGEEFTSASPLKLSAKIEGTEQITQIDLIRNNEFLYTVKPQQKDFDFEYEDKSPRTGENYYYIRVMQIDGNLAWASPVWVRYR